MKKTEINITVLGGCFPVQDKVGGSYNILKDRLYHQTLKKMIVDRYAFPVKINIIRYERFSTCLTKIIDSHRDKKNDLIIFHLRAEPVMRMIKIYYKYLDDKNELKKSLNIPFLFQLNSERYDLLAARRINIAPPTFSKKESSLHSVLKNLNYVLGDIIGNKKYAFQKYYELVASINDFCRVRKIGFVVTGPVSRPVSTFENKISEELYTYFKVHPFLKELNLIDCLGTVNDRGEELFFANGIHVSQSGHDQISQKIYDKIGSEHLL